MTDIIKVERARGLSTSDEIIEASKQYGEANQQLVAHKLNLGRAMGLPMAVAMNSIYLEPRSGRIGIGATAYAICLRNSGEWDYRWLENTRQIAKVQFYRKIKGELEPWGTWEFTWEDAQQAGLTGKTKNGKDTTWLKYPKVMLAHRALSQGIRMHCPEVISGVPAEDSEGLLAEINLKEAESVDAADSILADFGNSDEDAPDIGDLP